MQRLKIVFLCFAFVSSGLNIPLAHAGEIIVPLMPKPGTMVSTSSQFKPSYLSGIIVHPDNALKFDFLINKGNSQLDTSQKNQEYLKLVKYFLASLTIPDDDQWVNLSPYENDRIIKDNFGKTEMGRDLLSQDYLLKQITASLMYPESGLGKNFWNKVYEQIYAKFSNGDAEKQINAVNKMGINTFNKVWIVPDKALVYESGTTAYVVESHLKVLLETDYLALQKQEVSKSILRSSEQQYRNEAGLTQRKITEEIIRSIILPELEREVNEGKNFAQLRQIFSGMVLAAWYKQALKESLLGKVYADKAKVKGVELANTPYESIGDPQKIYQQYLAAFKKGVYNYIKEDVDKYTKQIIPRKYFSGGYSNAAMRSTLEIQKVSPAQLSDAAQREEKLDLDLTAVDFDPFGEQTANPNATVDFELPVKSATVHSITGTTAGDAPYQKIEIGNTSLQHFTKSLTGNNLIFIKRLLSTSGMDVTKIPGIIAQLTYFDQTQKTNTTVSLLNVLESNGIHYAFGIMDTGIVVFYKDTLDTTTPQVWRVFSKQPNTTGIMLRGDALSNEIQQQLNNLEIQEIINYPNLETNPLLKAINDSPEAIAISFNDTKDVVNTTDINNRPNPNSNNMQWYVDAEGNMIAVMPSLGGHLLYTFKLHKEDFVTIEHVEDITKQDPLGNSGKEVVPDFLKDGLVINKISWPTITQPTARPYLVGVMKAMQKLWAENISLYEEMGNEFEHRDHDIPRTELMRNAHIIGLPAQFLLQARLDDSLILTHVDTKETVTIGRNEKMVIKSKMSTFTIVNSGAMIRILDGTYVDTLDYQDLYKTTYRHLFRRIITTASSEIAQLNADIETKKQIASALNQLVKARIIDYNASKSTSITVLKVPNSEWEEMIQRKLGIESLKIFHKRSNMGITIMYPKANQAMIGAENIVKSTEADVGGIDLNAKNLNLSIKRDGKGVPLPFSQQDLNALQKIEGFIPRIIEIKPASTLPMFNQVMKQNENPATPT